jgi:hypothetical protein
MTISRKGKTSEEAQARQMDQRQQVCLFGPKKINIIQTLTNRVLISLEFPLVDLPRILFMEILILLGVMSPMLMATTKIIIHSN